jgi:hypothetical protein
VIHKPLFLYNHAVTLFYKKKEKSLGSNGLNGFIGLNGSNGSNGLNGSNGSNGLSGSNGSDGSIGSNGFSRFEWFKRFGGSEPVPNRTNGSEPNRTEPTSRFHSLSQTS